MDLVSKNNKRLAPLVIVFLTILLGVGFYFFTQVQKNSTLENDLTFNQLLQKEYDRSDPIYLGAFGNWKTYQLEDFSLDIPEGDPTQFSLNQYGKSEHVSQSRDITVIRIASVYTYSPYYDRLRNSNEINLTGGMNVYEVIKPKPLSVEGYIAMMNIKEKCDQQGVSLRHEEAMGEEIGRTDSGLTIVYFQPEPNKCEQTTPPPQYLVDVNGKLFVFDGGHEPYPGAVMEKILSSIIPQN